MPIYSDILVLVCLLFTLLPKYGETWHDSRVSQLVSVYWLGDFRGKPQHQIISRQRWLLYMPCLPFFLALSHKSSLNANPQLPPPACCLLPVQYAMYKMNNTMITKRLMKSQHCLKKSNNIPSQTSTLFPVSKQLGIALRYHIYSRIIFNLSISAAIPALLCESGFQDFPFPFLSSENVKKSSSHNGM